MQVLRCVKVNGLKWNTCNFEMDTVCKKVLPSGEWTWGVSPVLMQQHMPVPDLWYLHTCWICQPLNAERGTLQCCLCFMMCFVSYLGPCVRSVQLLCRSVCIFCSLDFEQLVTGHICIISDVRVHFAENTECLYDILPRCWACVDILYVLAANFDSLFSSASSF